jgi:hypothetical protein
MSSTQNRRARASASQPTVPPAVFSVGAVLVNRWWMLSRDGRVRIAFAEQGEDGDHYRNAISMHPNDALALAHQIIGTFGQPPSVPVAPEVVKAITPDNPSLDADALLLRTGGGEEPTTEEN